jgi:5-methylcytosine-specific restriction endonuclease McrA
MDATLLLNATYEPISIISWRKAITLLVLEKVEPLANYARRIRSAALSIEQPAVVRLLNRVPWRRPRIRFSRRNVFLRDQYICQYCEDRCSMRRLTLDHVLPRSQGGPTSWTNIVTSCQSCNQFKADRTPEQAGMSLTRSPFTPYWLPSDKGRGGYTQPESWTPYLW